MKRYLLGSLVVIPIIVAAVISCTAAQKLKCDLEDGLEGTIAYGIETVLQCSGNDAVRTSVNGWVDSAGVCPTDVKKLKAIDPSSICGVILGSLANAAGADLTQTINSKFPAWNCNPSMAVSALSTLASAACTAVFPVAGVLAKPASAPSAK